MNKVQRKQQRAAREAVDQLVSRIKEEIRTMNTFSCPTYAELEGKNAAYKCVHEAQAYLVEQVDRIYNTHAWEDK